MKGDFSRWKLADQTGTHATGVLHQQGRVLLDSDWNTQHALIQRWQDDAARDVIGRGLLAVPAETPEALRVLAAERDAEGVRVRLGSGSAWADGLGVQLSPDEPAGEMAERVARYMGAPLPGPAPAPSDVVFGDRDLVVLEVWREAISAFQPDEESWLEPALGGVDTTERVVTALRPRLLRLQEGESCRDGLARLAGAAASPARLTVTLQPPEEEDGDCPTVEAGGYLGFEHHLFRIEVAESDGPPAFKWSRFNGGLVGRGRADLANDRVEITANLQPIEMSGLDAFYMEIIEPDPDSGASDGVWKVTYGADVRLREGELEVETVRHSEGVPSGPVFFRLWDGLRRVSDFHPPPEGEDPAALQEGLGIRLELSDLDADHYRPGDYWTFAVRAEGAFNLHDDEESSPLVDDEPPHGVDYHHVPVAILEWGEDADVTVEDAEIHDCRDLFRPLTRQETCCTFTVGDGRLSFGDFNEIREALRHLPEEGGELCLLPGVHSGGVVIEGRRDVRIRGCAERTLVLPDRDALSDPVFRVVDSSGIELSGLDVIAATGLGLRVEATELGAAHRVELLENRVLARTTGIDLVDATEVDVRGSVVRMLDLPGGGVGLSVAGEDVRIEDNDFGVIMPEEPDEGGDEEPGPPPHLDDCAEPEEVYEDVGEVVDYAQDAWTDPWDASTGTPPLLDYRALGGIQVHAAAERVDVRRNRVHGGSGNGITLGTEVDLGLVGGGGQGGSVEVAHQGEVIEGVVVDELGAPVPDLMLTFAGSGGAASATTASDGTFRLVAAPDDYTLSSAEIGWVIRSATLEQTELDMSFWRVVAGEREARQEDPLAALAFLYEIVVEDNEIAGMGRSGIGLPDVQRFDMLDAADAKSLATADPGLIMWLLVGWAVGVLSAPVSGLRIDGNRIHHCLLTPPDEPFGAWLPRGEGGISLGLTERLAIHDNAIEDNGRDHRTPVCGIWVLTTERAEMGANRIAANGTITGSMSGVRAGMRGGIVTVLASSYSLADALGGGDDEAGWGHALRLHDNVVEQPLGRALTVGALGPVAVTNNRLHTTVADESVAGQVAGAVLVVNLGGLPRLGRLMAGLGGGAATADPTGEEASENEVPAEADLLGDLTETLPDGNTLVADNQIRLDRRRGSRMAQVVVSLDDLAYANNQSDVDESPGSKGAPPLLHALLAGGGSLRVNGNRFKERPDALIGRAPPGVVSAFTIAGFLNNTSHNQGDHCVLGATVFESTLTWTDARVMMGNQWLVASNTSWSDQQLCEMLNQYMQGGGAKIFGVLAYIFGGD